ncbi:MAG: hypothetical protein QXU79_00305 [Candidatus Micrarchaeaceae archaeon]
MKRLTKRALENLRAEAQKLVNEWKPVLGLSDWDVRVQVVPSGEEEAPCWTVFVWTTREATITVRADAFLRGALGWDVNLEQAVIHELLHLLFPMVNQSDTEDAEYSIFEQALNSLAKAFVNLRRASAPSSNA